MTADAKRMSRVALNDMEFKGDFNAFRVAVSKVEHNARSTTADVQVLLMAATQQTVTGNANWINALLTHDFRGMKREAMVAWLFAFTPIKVVARDDNKRIIQIKLLKGWNDDKWLAKLKQGRSTPWHTFKTEKDGEDTAKQFHAATKVKNLLKQIKENIGNIPAAELEQVAKLFKLEAQQLEIEASIKAHEAPAAAVVPEAMI